MKWGNRQQKLLKTEQLDQGICIQNMLFKLFHLGFITYVSSQNAFICKENYTSD